MNKIGDILQTDYLQEQQRISAAGERNWAKWLADHNHDPDTIDVLVQYAEALVRIGVDLTNFDLMEAIAGYAWYLEDAILATLSKQDLDNATAFLIKALRSQGGMWKHQKMRTQRHFPVYRAADWQPEYSSPSPGYFEAVKQRLQHQRRKSSLNKRNQPPV